MGISPFCRGLLLRTVLGQQMPMDSLQVSLCSAPSHRLTWFFKKQIKAQHQPAEITQNTK